VFQILCELTMTELSEQFLRLKQSHEKALIPFFICGFPSAGVFKDFIKGAADSGADAIEIGIPFSDPLADGPSIQYSSNLALNNGINLQKSLEMISSLKVQLSLPLIILTYANPVFQYGLEEFIREAKQAGVSGLIVADLVIEEASQIEKLCRFHGLDLIYLAAPTSKGSRLKRIASRSSGFIYLVSVAGVTGARRVIPRSLAAKIGEIKRFTDKPVCVGFGISNPLQAGRLVRLADGVIVGSALVDLIRESKNQAQMSRKVSRFLVSLKKGMQN
jgi:tryptophan synthase alpha chain